MNWNDLKIFLAVARAGKLTSAAHMLGQDATTVSRHVLRLEQELQTTLFEQGRDGRVLTSAGTALLKRAEQMEAAAIEIEESLTGEGRPGGTVRISLSEGFGSLFVARHLQHFAEAHPDIAVELVASTGFLSPSRREADIAIVLERPKAGPLITRKLTDYHLGLYAAPAYLKAAPALDSVADLARHRLVSYVPDLIYAPELRYLDELGQGLEPALMSNSIIAQASLLASGAGCGILPCFIGDIRPDLVRLFPDGVDIRRSFWLSVHRDVRGIARVAETLRWLEQLVLSQRALLLGQTSTATSQT